MHHHELRLVNRYQRSRLTSNPCVQLRAESLRPILNNKLIRPKVGHLKTHPETAQGCWLKVCTLNTINVHATRVSGRAEEEVSGNLIGRDRTPPLRLPEPCACYAEGYAAGKDKAYFEMLASLEGTPHAKGCACQPCQVKRACLQKVMTLMAQKLARDLRTGGGLGPGGPRQPALKRRPFPGKCLSSFWSLWRKHPRHQRQTSAVSRSTWWSRTARRWPPLGSSVSTRDKRQRKETEAQAAGREAPDRESCGRGAFAEG